MNHNSNCHVLDGWMKQEFKTIGEMSAQFDVTTRTLRFYEAKELLFPKREGTKRFFSKSDCARLKLILMGKRFGFSLEEIRQLLNLYHAEDGQKQQLFQANKFASARLEEMLAQRDALNEAIEDLKEKILWGEKMLDSFSSQNSKSKNTARDNSPQ